MSFPAQLAGELIAAGLGRTVGSVDLGLDVGDEVGTNLTIAFGGFGVVADHEALPTFTVTDVHLFDAQVAGGDVAAAGRASASRAPPLALRSFSAMM